GVRARPFDRGRTRESLRRRPDPWHGSDRRPARGTGAARGVSCAAHKKPLILQEQSFALFWAISLRAGMGPMGKAGLFTSLSGSSGGLRHVFRSPVCCPLVALSIAACAGTPETGQGPKENTGTLVGAVAGGLIGSQFGGGTGERIAAGLAGAALGGLVGNPIRPGMGGGGKRRALSGAVPAPG